MFQKKPCVICGKLSSKALFKGTGAEVHVCSLICENQYIGSLGYDKTGQHRVRQYFDEKINRMKLLERLGWVTAAFGILLILNAIFWANYQSTKLSLLGPMLFVTGIIPLTSGTLSTVHFGSGKKRLMERRRQLN